MSMLFIWGPMNKIKIALKFTKQTKKSQDTDLYLVNFTKSWQER
jgi:hypothetical protein